MIENNLNLNKISYKLIEHERVEDAPFMGALISACNCNFNCKSCFNQSIKNLPTINDTTEHIIAQIKANPFNKGVIFAGLEWTLQLRECFALATLAKQEGLLTMIYTGSTDSRMLGTLKLSGIFDYIKYGRYREDLKSANHIEYGVALASSNQHILKRGVDY